MLSTIGESVFVTPSSHIMSCDGYSIMGEHGEDYISHLIGAMEAEQGLIPDPGLDVGN